MAYKEDDNIEDMFGKDTSVLPNDVELKTHTLSNRFRSEHGKLMSDHSKEYTRLLKEYIGNAKTSFEQKTKFKKIFFWVSIVILSLSFVLFFVMCVSFLFIDLNKENISVISGMVSSLVGLLSLYIIIPKIIARYLFNRKEDKHMAMIVESIQNYDERVFSSMNANNFGGVIEKEEAARILKKLKEKAKEKGQPDTEIAEDLNDISRGGQ